MSTSIDPIISSLFYDFFFCSTVARMVVEMTYGVRPEGPENEVRSMGFKLVCRT